MSAIGPVLVAHHLSHHYGERQVLKQVSLSIEPGAMLVVMGASGCGKSTLLEILAGLQVPQQGEVIAGGLSLASHEQLCRKQRQSWLGLVMQGIHLYPHLSVMDNITLAPRKVLRQRKAAVEERAYTLLDRFALSKRANAMPKALSQGESQRVALVRALISRPPLLLLDEPTASLDEGWSTALAQVLKEFAAVGSSALVMTHDRHLARQLDDWQRTEQLRMQDGSLSPKSVKEPAHLRIVDRAS